MILDRLPDRDSTRIAHAVAVLEQASGAVPADRLPELRHPDLRPAVDRVLDAAGRVVVEHLRGEQPVAYATGYADDVAARLAASGVGVLDAVERAVVALVLLRCVALPAARGQPPARWSQAEPTFLDRLHDNRRLTKRAVADAVNRLHDRQILVNARRAGIRPGPAFDRLTDTQRRRIEEDLFLLVAPADPVAAALRRRREDADRRGGVAHTDERADASGRPPGEDTP